MTVSGCQATPQVTLRDSESGRTQAIPDTLHVRALAYDHSCDLPFCFKVDVTPGRAGPHRQVGAFFRGVILIGALCKVLRLPLLQESGRLRQKHGTPSVTMTKSGRNLQAVRRIADTREERRSTCSAGFAPASERARGRAPESVPASREHKLRPDGGVALPVRVHLRAHSRRRL